ncbi:hypothetical protein P4S60_16800 [Pseudoalteromonas sp. Hal040]|uniref:hypothetical protein n=1 Tax=unclassified Pseudoalteromonas TaxID=194690 RepID=UPI00301CF451
MDNQQQDVSCSTVKTEQDSNVEEQTKTTQQKTQPASNQHKAWFTNERLNLFLALCAIIISAASFYATYLQASAAERQVKAATWPWLEVMTGNFNEEKILKKLLFTLKTQDQAQPLLNT